VIDLAIYNRCLLSKWFFNLINTDEAWQQLLRNKYLGRQINHSGGKKPKDSQFWSGLMNVKDQYLSMDSFKLQDGSKIDFGRING
jgi:hypothetical protein